MPVTDADLQLIFQYLDNELSDGEEQELLQRMQENPELQQAFDQQILMSKYLEKSEEIQAEEAAFESADDYVNRITSVTNKPVEPDRVVLPITKKRWQMLAAAAAVAALVTTAIFYYTAMHQHNQTPVTKSPLRKKLPATNDSTVLLPDTTRQLADRVLPEKLYAEYATPLDDNNLQLPAAAQAYQGQYQQGRYTELTEADENTVITKGERPAGEEQAIINYFNFYKALAYLETKQPVKAEKLLKDVMKKSRTNSALNNHTKWYLLLLYLKAGNKPEAQQLAASIAANQSNLYRKRAAEIVEKLSR